jgi:hypothetical protein
MEVLNATIVDDDYNDEEMFMVVIDGMIHIEIHDKYTEEKNLCSTFEVSVDHMRRFLEENATKV